MTNKLVKISFTAKRKPKVERELKHVVVRISSQKRVNFATVPYHLFASERATGSVM